MMNQSAPQRSLIDPRRASWSEKPVRMQRWMEVASAGFLRDIKPGALGQAQELLERAGHLPRAARVNTELAALLRIEVAPLREPPRPHEHEKVGGSPRRPARPREFRPFALPSLRNKIRRLCDSAAMSAAARTQPSRSAASSIRA